MVFFSIDPIVIDDKGKKIKKFFLDEEFEEILNSSLDINRDLSIIGTGSYSNVYCFKNKYAIKILKSNYCQGLDCIPEIVILNSISKDHDNIVKGYGIFTYENSLCFVMDKADTTLNRYKFSNQENKADVISQITSALNFLHDNYFLHLDLTPNNILIKIVNGFPKALLSDFSLSCKTLNLKLESESPKISVYYRPYENLKGSNIYTNKSDLWSLGIIIYEIINDIIFEEQISNIFVDSEYNPELSTIVHIEKMIAWNIWPLNNLLNINSDLRTCDYTIKKEINNYNRIVSYQELINSLIANISKVFSNDEYKLIDPIIDNWYTSCYCIIYCLFNPPDNLYHILFSNKLKSLLYILKFLN